MKHLSPGTHSPTPSTAPPRNGHRYQVIAYLRVSHDLQEGNFTFDTQLSRIREKLDRVYGRDRYDLEVYQDNGLSGGYGPSPTGVQKRTRPTLRELEAKLTSGQYDCLAVYKLNRLFRSTRWIEQWLEDVIIPSGVAFYSATEDIDSTTQHGRTMIRFIAMGDENQRESAAERNRDAMATRVELGYLLGPPPYGWQRQPLQSVPNGARRGIVRNEEQVPHVQFIIKKYLAGWGSIKIAADLNRRGVPTSKGKKWTAGLIMGVLTNPVHAGYVTSRRKGLLQGQHFEQRLCELSTLEEVDQMRQQRRRSGSTNTHKADQPHLVNGIATCARCGKRLYIYTGNGSYRAYRCTNGKNEGEPTCPEVTIRADMVEDLVVAEITRLAEQPQVRKLLQEQAERATQQDTLQLQAEVKRLQAALQELEERRGRLLDALTAPDGTIDKADYDLGRSRLQQQEVPLREQLQQAEHRLSTGQQQEVWRARLQQAILDFPLCWAHLHLDERRQVMRLLVEKLSVDRQGRDAVVQLKLHLLPQQQHRLCFQSMRQMKDRPTGVAGLTRRQMAFLHHCGQRLSYAEVAQAMGVPMANVYTWAMQVRKILGVRDLQDAYGMARTRIESLLPHLPLGPTNLIRIHREALLPGEAPVLHPSLLPILELLSEGASVPEIADLTGQTQDAVRAKKKRILDALRVETTFQAKRKAQELGLLS